MRRRILVVLALLPQAIALPVLAMPTVTAVRCDACTYRQLEQRAIGLGVGERYLYDFSNQQLHLFQVSSEPAPDGRYRYEAVVLAVPVEYMSYFNKVLDYRRRFGSTQLIATVNLPQAPGPYSSMNVFDLYRNASSATAFGNWLAAFVMNEGANNPAAQKMAEIAASKGHVDLQEDAVEVHVFVNFRNGKAQFKLTKNGQGADLIPGTGYDSESNPIPANRSQIVELPYVFAGGTTSSNYQDFLALIRGLGIPIGNRSGAWACVSVAGLGERCQLIR